MCAFLGPKHFSVHEVTKYSAENRPFATNDHVVHGVGKSSLLFPYWDTRDLKQTRRRRERERHLKM